MILQDCYIEEDLFPKIFTKYEERDYGILFYNTENKDSFGSNHAVIYRERIQNLQAVLLKGKPVGLLYGHISERACRVDYLIVSKKYRKLGAGRALFCRYVEWCKELGIENCYIWPDGETPKRIYEEGGYRLAEICRAGRAVMEYE